MDNNKKDDEKGKKAPKAHPETLSTLAPAGKFMVTDFAAYAIRCSDLISYAAFW